jgi:hypothetical protein
VFILALAIVTGVEAREQHVRWINHYTVQITFTPEKSMYLVCYERKNKIEVPQGINVGCLQVPTTGNVTFELGRNKDYRYNPNIGDEYRISITYKDGHNEYYGTWMGIENERPPVTLLFFPVIVKFARL